MRLVDILDPLQDGDVVGVAESVDVCVFDDEVVLEGLPRSTKLLDRRWLGAHGRRSFFGLGGGGTVSANSHPDVEKAQSADTVSTLYGAPASIARRSRHGSVTRAHSCVLASDLEYRPHVTEP